MDDIKYIVLLFIVGLLTYLAINSVPVAPNMEALVEDGIVRLDRVDLDGNIAVVGGPWRSYRERLLKPEDFTSGLPGEGEEFRVGVDSRLWRYGTHRMTASLPAGRTWGLYFRSLDYATRVYINGELMGEIGTVGAAEDESVPMTTYCWYYFTPLTDKTEIILQFSNFHHVDGGNPPVLRISAPSNIMRMAQKTTFGECVVILSLATAAIYSVGMYFLHGRRLFLLFSLTCAAFSLRSFILLPMFFPVYNWHIAIRFEYAVIFSAFAFLGLFLQNLFPGRISKKIIWPSVGLLCCYLAIITFAAPAFFSSLVVYYQILCTLMVFYSILMLAGGLRGSGGSIPESLAFFGLLPFAALVINDALALNNLPNLGNNNLMPEGIVVFMFAYMLILASEFAENERALLAVRQQEEKITAENFTLERLNRIKTEFLSNISHELKTPLTIMSSYAQLSKIQINMGEAERGEISGNLQVITSEAEHLALMVGQLLDVSRVEEGRSKLEKTPASVGEIVKNVVDTYFPALNKNNNRLELDVADDLPLVYADARKIGQVLVNLISNAVKNTRDGIITILAEFSGDDLESAEKDFVKITVSDTGVGIDESLMPHIFERYATGGAKNSGGTGLGLYVSQSFVEGHGGRIWAENNPGAGTRVCFTLPVYISSNDENMKQ